MGIKTCKKGKNINFYCINKRLREAKVKFLIEYEKKEFKYFIITLYIEETPDTNISDIFNELKQIVAHDCFYISGKANRTLISHPFRGVPGLIPFPNSYFDVLLDNAFKVEQKVKYK